MSDIRHIQVSTAAPDPPNSLDLALLLILQVSLSVMNSASVGHDEEVLRVKKEVESLWLGKMVQATPRQRQRMAQKLDIRGGGIFADNLGIVSASNYNNFFLILHLYFYAEADSEVQHGAD